MYSGAAGIRTCNCIWRLNALWGEIIVLDFAGDERRVNRLSPGAKHVWMQLTWAGRGISIRAGPPRETRGGARRGAVDARDSGP